MCGNFLIYSIRNLLSVPSYVCEIPKDSGTFESCTQDYICENRKWLNYQIDYSDYESLLNWVTTLDLLCN